MYRRRFTALFAPDTVEMFSRSINVGDDAPPAGGGSGDDKGKTEADKAKAAEAEAAAAKEAATAEAERKAAEDKRINAEAEKRAKVLIKAELDKRAKDAEEAAELEKKDAVGKETAKREKAEREKAEAEGKLADLTTAVEASNELSDQDLKPASPKAREHILAAYKLARAEGKDAAAAMKHVLETEAYLFKAKEAAPAADPTKKPLAQGGKTAPPASGNTVIEAKPKVETAKNPGDVTDLAEFRKLVRAKHGINVR